MLGPRNRPVRYHAREAVNPTNGIAARVYARQPARAHGSSGTWNSSAASTPPGRSTRASSAIVAAGSSTYRSRYVNVRPSKVSSANGSRSARQRTRRIRASNCVPRIEACAPRSIASLWSRATTRRFRRTSSRATSPVPDATSSTHEPGGLRAEDVVHEVVPHHRRPARGGPERGKRGREVRLGGLAADHRGPAARLLEADDVRAAVELQPFLGPPKEVPVHPDELGPVEQQLERPVHRGVGEGVAGSADHHDVGLAVGAHELDALEVGARVALRDHQDPRPGMMRVKVLAGGDHGRDDLGGVDLEAGVSQGRREGCPRVRRGVRDQAERHALVSELRERVDRPGERLPGDRQHAVDVEEHAVERARGHGAGSNLLEDRSPYGAMNRYRLGSNGRNRRIASSVARFPTSPNDPSRPPYSSRISGGSVANASRDTICNTGRHSASRGGWTNRSATRRAASVTCRMPERHTSSMYARSSGTVGGIRSRDSSTSSAASICSSWNR